MILFIHFIIFQFSVIKKHFDLFIVFLSTSEIVFDVICLVETWLENNSLTFEIYGYTSYDYYRQLNTSDNKKMFLSKDCR